MLWGAIIGDIVGSRFEFNNIATKEFELFAEDCSFTDDSMMTIAVAEGLLESYGKDEAALSLAVKERMREWGRKYPSLGYGERFSQWLSSDEAEAYDSFGNGSAMRISAVGWLAKTEEEVKRLSYLVTALSHTHIEAIKGAEAVAMAIFWARQGKRKGEIWDLLAKNYYPDLNAMYYALLLQYYAKYGRADAPKISCQGSVPEALFCFLISDDFEDAIRTAISIGGDSDTIAAIAGSVAEAFYGVEEKFILSARKYLPQEILCVVDKLESEK